MSRASRKRETVQTAGPPAANAVGMWHRRSTWVVFAAGLVVALGGAVVRLTLGPDVPAARASGSASPSEAQLASSSSSSSSSWKRYGPDGSFQVVAPSPPQEGQQQASFGVIHQARFPSPDGEVYAVLWFDVPADRVAGATDAQLVDAWTTNVLGGLGGEIDEEDVLKDGPYRGVELRVVKGGTTYLIRVFAAHGRVVEAGASLATGAADRAAAQRFVDSLEILVQ